MKRFLLLTTLLMALSFSSSLFAQNLDLENTESIRWKDTGGTWRSQIMSTGNVFSVTPMGQGQALRFGDGTVSGSPSDTWFGSISGNSAPSNVPFIIKSTGLIGIGTNNPENILHAIDISGHLKFGRPGSEMNNRLTLDANSGYENQIYFRSGNGRIFTAGKHITLGTSSSSSDLVIAPNSGYVGIGTSSPVEKLHVTGSILMQGNNLDGDNLNYLQNSRSLLIGWNRSSGNGETNFITNRGAGSTGGFDFREITNSGVENILLKIKGDGKVGIGTTNPTAKFHIIDGGGFARSSTAGQGGWFVKRDITTSSGGLFTVQNGNNSYAIYARGDGNVGIGTNNPKSKLAVNGQIRATEVKVLADITVPDYVFEEDYELRTLEETQEYIAANKHLPEIPSAAEIGENGIDLGDMNMRLLKKIEELTLHLIEQNEKLEVQNSIISKQNERIQKLEEKLD